MMNSTRRHSAKELRQTDPDTGSARLLSLFQDDVAERKSELRFVVALIVVTLLLGMAISFLPQLLGAVVEPGAAELARLYLVACIVGLIMVWLGLRGHARLAAVIMILYANATIFYSAAASIEGQRTIYYLIVPTFFAAGLLSRSALALQVTLNLFFSMLLVGMNPNVTVMEALAGPFRFHLLVGGMMLLLQWYRNQQEAARVRKIAQQEQQYRSLLHMSFVGVIVHDRRQLLDINADAARLFGYRPDEIAGQSLRTLFTEASQAVINESDVAPVERPVELEGVHRDGFLIYLEAVSSSQLVGKRTVQLMALRDITERKEKERVREHLAQFAAGLRVASDRQSMPPVIVKLIAELLPADAVMLLIVEDQPAAVRVEAQVGFPEAEMANHSFVAGNVLRDVWQTGEPAGNSSDEPPPLPVALIESNWRFARCYPLFQNEAPLGAVWAARDSRFFPVDDRIMMEIMHLIGNALARATMHQVTRNYALEMETRVAERTHELLSANERLKELDRLKSKFISDVTHELRTPVTNLTLYLDLLSSGKPEKRAAYVKVLYEQAERLRFLVDDTLSLARIDLGDHSPEFKKVSLTQAARQTVEAHRSRATARGVQLQFKPGSADLHISAAPLQLEQILTNLLANALNYTYSGRISVELERNAAANQAVLRVVDTGIGIEAQDMPHLYDRFYRGAAASQSNIPGNGLGLAIVKENVKLHGGDIAIDSVVGEGTTVTVSFPIAPAVLPVTEAA